VCNKDFDRRGEAETMKKAFILLISIGLIASAAVACGGYDVIKEIGTRSNVPVSYYFDDDYYADGDFMADFGEFEHTGDDFNIDWGSDMTFDIDDIILPCEDEDCDIDKTRPYYLAKSGTVVNVESRGNVNYVTIEDDGAITVLLVGEDTLFPFSDRIEVGAAVTGWFPANAPAPAIYPPQYMVSVFAAGVPEGVNVRLNLFNTWEDNDNGYFISHDGSFAFGTDENTEVVLEDGIKFIGDEFDGRRIVVIYGASTRSIPEMTVANRLIVLYESITPFRF
jgi:hypothetical protein